MLKQFYIKCTNFSRIICEKDSKKVSFRAKVKSWNEYNKKEGSKQKLRAKSFCTHICVRVYLLNSQLDFFFISDLL